MDQKIIKKAIKENIKSQDELNVLKRRTAKIYKKSCPSNFALRKIYNKLLKKGTIQKNKRLEQLLLTRPVRTLSGIAALTVLTKPYPCPGNCLYCPQESQMPKSYLKKEPAAQRAYLTNFDPYLQVKTRIASLKTAGHNTEKIELIILGGSFPAYPKKYQEEFVTRCFDALNNNKLSVTGSRLSLQEKHPKLDQALEGHPKGCYPKTYKNLVKAQKTNETAYHRCVGLSVEARPDQVNIENIKWWRHLGITRVEIGAQTVFDETLKKCNRGHTVADTIKATRLLKDWGFKIVYHIMANLPGATPQKDLQTFKILFSNSHFQPDQLKIYPLVVLKEAPLYKIWQQGKYKPYSPQVLKKLLRDIKKIIPPYVRIIRLIRDIPASYIVAGNEITNLRQILQQEGVKCRCIRCREAKSAPLKKPHLFIQKYPASRGEEYYLSYENKKQTTLYAHLRLRFPSPKSYLADYALIRELHTYGKVAPLLGKQKNSKRIQHKGLGKKLIKKAEHLAHQNGYSKIAVISGIGVKEYYRKLGYRLGKFGYMVKKL